MGNRKKGITLSYVNTIFNMICGLFLSSFLVKVLGDTEYGIYKTIGSFANYLVLLEFGTGTVIARNVSVCRSKNATEEEINKNVSTIWNITNALSLLILIVSIVFYFCIDKMYAESMTPEQIEYGKLIFIFITAYLIVSFYSQTLNGITLAFEHYSFSSVLEIARNAVRVIMLVGFILAWRYSIIIAIVDAFISLILVAVKFAFCKKKLRVKFGLKYIDKLVLKSVLPLCLALFLQTIVNQANSNVDQFIIGIVMTPEDVTLYSIALYIYSVYSAMMTIPISMYTPEVTKNVVEGKEGKELTKTLVAPSRLLAFIGGAILFGFVGFGRQFISMFYGDSYLLAWTIGLIIMVPSFINCTTGVLINVLNALNKRMARSAILIGTTIVNIGLTIWWIHIWGMVGAAVATAVCTVVGQLILMGIYYKRAININVLYLYLKAFKGIIIYQIIGAIASFFAGYFISNVYLSFAVAAITYGVVFLGLYLLFGASKQEKSSIKSIFKKVLNKIRRKNA